MRKAHWLKPTVALRTPSNVIVVDTETHWRDGSSLDVQLHTLTLGYALKYRREDGRRTRQKKAFFTTVADWWSFLAANLDKHKTTHVFGHNLGYDLGILDAWHTFKGDEWGFYRFAVERNIVFIDAVYHGCHVVFVDTFNYWKMSLEDIGESLGYPKLPLPDTRYDTPELRDRCRVDVEITALAVDNLLKWIEDNNYGPFGISAASLAMNTYKKRFMDHKILVHDNPRALKLERRAYFGGLVDTPFIGKPDISPVYECDVVSMYPSVCLGELPTKLVCTRRNPGRKLIEDLAERYMLIADVTIKTDKPLYPVRQKTGIVYPIGRFKTSLADAELRLAMELGHLRDCEYVAAYEHAPIFRRYMEHFLEQKQLARANGNAMHEILTKLMLNGLYGKTAQQTPIWATISEDSLQEAADWYKIPYAEIAFLLDKPPTFSEYECPLMLPHLKVTIPMRRLWQDVEIKIGERETRDSCPAIAACVTSASRVKLRHGQSECIYDGHLYSDTDSLWTSERDKEHLEQCGLIGHGVGQLEVKGICDSFTVYGRKDYVAENYRKLSSVKGGKKAADLIKRKGIRLKATPTDDGRWKQEKWDKPIMQIQRGERATVRVEIVKKRLHREITHCLVNGDGTTEPLTDEDLR